MLGFSSHRFACSALTTLGLGLALFSSNLAAQASAPAAAHHELDLPRLRQALQSPARDVSDFIRDPVRKPIETLTFLGLKPGMRVLDLYAAGGYYTVILAHAVGTEGHVIAQNTQRGRDFVEDRQVRSQGEALDNKIRRAGLSNVSQLIAPSTALEIEENSLDFILLAQTLHDYYNADPDDARTLLRSLHATLKPGGILGVSDHIGLADADNRRLHRMLPEQAINLAEEIGFSVQRSTLLQIDNDQPRRSIFDPSLARHTSRFLLRLEKTPADK